MSIFEFTDYRPALSDAVLERKKALGQAVTFQKMAKVCGVQKTYLSTVLKGNGHLNSDQLFFACEFLGFNEVESNYIELLHKYQRSGFQKRKDEIYKHIQSLQSKNQKTVSHISSPVAQTETDNLELYFLNPQLQLVHLLLTIERFAKDIQLIASTLNLEKEALNQILSSLQKMNLIKLVNGQYLVLRDNMVLSVDSPLCTPYRKLLKLQALELIQDSPNKGNYSFSALISTSEENKKLIQAKFFKLLKEIEEMVKSSPAEELYQINLDLLKWS